MIEQQDQQPVITDTLNEAYNSIYSFFNANTDSEASSSSSSSSPSTHSYEEFPKKKFQEEKSEYEEMYPHNNVKNNTEDRENKNDLHESTKMITSGSNSLQSPPMKGVKAKENESGYVSHPSMHELRGVRHVLPESLSRESLERSFGSSLNILGEVPGGSGIDPLLVCATMNTPLQDRNNTQTQYISSNTSSTPSTPSYGWFNMESMDEKLKQSKDLRDAYIAQTQIHIGHSNSGISSSSGGSTGSDGDYNDRHDPSIYWAPTSVDIDDDENLEYIAYDEIPSRSILFKWRNPNPSMTLKCSGSSMDEPSESIELRISCCIGGYRTVQLSCGSIRAEFQFIFSYGSKSFNCYKPFTEFRKLHKIISHVHKSNFSFPKAIQEWNRLRSRQKWHRCLSVVYLIEKSVLLGRYMQALLMESDSPGLLLYFVQSKIIAH